jgi:hypothetical protein
MTGADQQTYRRLVGEDNSAGLMTSDRWRTDQVDATGVSAGVDDIALRGGWGRAYRGEHLVCARVYITVGHDTRLGLTRRERRYVTARFDERLDAELRSELAQLARRRGASARRIADVLEAIELVLDEPGDKCQRIIGRLEPPQLRHGRLCDIEFGLREHEQ